ncbi:MAG: hypothetical protein V2J24_20485 [Pseudomonadales bacterium]|nr:hypothetical protein [Pseudomonadales bacterium]
MRETALCTGLAVLLVLDICALGCADGMAALHQVAVHLWGPTG